MATITKQHDMPSPAFLIRIVISKITRNVDNLITIHIRLLTDYMFHSIAICGIYGSWRFFLSSLLIYKEWDVSVAHYYKLIEINKHVIVRLFISFLYDSFSFIHSMLLSY